MSIIYEALKKIQESEPKRDQPKRISFFVYIIMTIIGIFLASLIFPFFARPKRIKPLTSSLLTSKPLEIEEKLLSTEEKELSKEIPSFSLSGILYSDTEKWVIINNRILKEGDIIEEAKVIYISDTGVELNWKGEKIFLK